jgi:hypothetical protein
MTNTPNTSPTPSEIKDLTRDELVSSVYWQLDTEKLPLVVSGLVRTREDALEVFRLIVALVQHEAPGVEEWLSTFNRSYQALQCWDDLALAKQVAGDDTVALDSARNFLKHLCDRKPESNELYLAYNLTEALELAWNEVHYQAQL